MEPNEEKEEHPEPASHNEPPGVLIPDKGGWWGEDWWEKDNYEDGLWWTLKPGGGWVRWRDAKDTWLI